MKKRGISPLIATVLIIGFTIVLAALVISWGSGLFKTTVERTEDVSDFNIICSTEVGFKATVQEQFANSIDYYVKVSNTKEQPIEGFFFTVQDETRGYSQSYNTHKVSLPDLGGNDVLRDLDNNINTNGEVILSESEANLESFETSVYWILRVDESERNFVENKKVDIRAIVKNKDGGKKVCEQLSTVIVQAGV